MSVQPPQPPLLRTIVPVLRNLEREVTDWLAAPGRKHPMPPLVRANLEGLAVDLRRRADDLDLDQPLLVVMFMGGTGVGKSTLLNALAGAAIATASFTRPTTRDPVVYHHASVKPQRLDPALRACRLVAHDREELREKVLVDTPDLDSNEEENRERLMAVLPVADVVLYVGSQEKYHDRLGWDIFRAQRQRRAFAFVLNKWDRCTQPTAGGLRPDEDLLRDLTSEGFVNPLLFRTAAQYWIDRASGSTGGPPPEGEQFHDLLRWLEDGLTRLEIEALKTRGISQLLDHLRAGLAAAKPPDVTAVAAKTAPVWESLVETESEELAAALVHALEPQQREIEHHFRLTGQQRFQGPMAAYLGAINWLQTAGIRFRHPTTALTGEPHSAAPWDVTGLTRHTLNAASHRGLTQRVQALGDRLLVAADGAGFPGDLLAPRLKELTTLDWRSQLGTAVGESLAAVEGEWANPTGWRRIVRGGLILCANFAPVLTFVGSVLLLIWNVIMRDHPLTLASVAVPFVLTLAVMMVFHVLIFLLLPLRWPAIRSDFRNQLSRTVRERLGATYLPLPAAVAADLTAERATVEAHTARVSELRDLLESRRQAAGIDAMYGSGVTARVNKS